jgi:uncharacterized membrane protein YbhN (UPF0104 family)
MFVKVAVSALLFAGLLWVVDLGAVAAVLQRTDIGLGAAATGLLFVQAVLAAARWQVIAAQLGVSVTFRQSLYWVMIGQFLNLALPTSIGGDAFRVWILRRTAGTPLGTALLTVVVERGSGLLLLALLVSACAWSLRGHLPQETLAVLLALGPVAVLAVLPLASAARWGAILPGRLAALVRRIGEALALLMAQPGRTAAVLALGVAASAVGLLAGWTMSRAVGLDLPIPQVMTLVGAAVIVAALPISFGGWGVREASMVGLFALLQVPAEPAIATSLLWGFLPVLLSAPVVLAWVLFGDRKALSSTAEVEP